MSCTILYKFFHFKYSIPPLQHAYFCSFLLTNILQIFGFSNVFMFKYSNVLRMFWSWDAEMRLAYFVFIFLLRQLYSSSDFRYNEKFWCVELFHHMKSFSFNPIFCGNFSSLFELYLVLFSKSLVLLIPFHKPRWKFNSNSIRRILLRPLKPYWKIRKFEKRGIVYYCCIAVCIRFSPCFGDAYHRIIDRSGLVRLRRRRKIFPFRDENINNLFSLEQFSQTKKEVVGGPGSDILKREAIAESIIFLIPSVENLMK